MWKELMLSARSRSLCDWETVLPDLDMAILKDRYLDPAPGTARRVLCRTKHDCPETQCSFRDIRDLSTGTSACCTLRYGIQPVKTTPLELSCFSLSYARFHVALCAELGLELSNSDLDDGFFWELGMFKYGAAKRTPVYLSYLHSAEQLAIKINDLLLRAPAAFALIVFDRSLIRSKTESAMAEKKCFCLALPEILRMNRDCSFSKIGSVASIFTACKSEKQIPDIRTYQCAADTKWCDLCLTHEDSETVMVSLNGEPAIPLSYRAMGLYSKKDDKPTAAFKLLLCFLDTQDGTVPIPAKTSKEYDYLVQHKKELTACFKKVFPTISDGPAFEYDGKAFCYRAKFLTHRPVVITH